VIAVVLDAVAWYGVRPQIQGAYIVPKTTQQKIMAGAMLMAAWGVALLTTLSFSFVLIR
jgi:hypothetical protein